MASLYMYVLWVKHASLPCLFLPPNSGLPSYFKTVHLLLSYVSFLNCISCTWESHMLLPLVPPCDWRADPVFRSTGYSCRGPGFHSQHPPGGSQRSLTPVAESTLPSSDLMYAHRHNSHGKLKKNNKTKTTYNSWLEVPPLLMIIINKKNNKNHYASLCPINYITYLYEKIWHIWSFSLFLFYTGLQVGDTDSCPPIRV